MKNVFFIDKNNNIRTKAGLKTECKKCGAWIMEKPRDAGNSFFEREDEYGGRKILYAESIGWKCQCGAIDRPFKNFFIK